jgi:hypothetical protein
MTTPDDFLVTHTPVIRDLVEVLRHLMMTAVRKLLQAALDLPTDKETKLAMIRSGARQILSGFNRNTLVSYKT